MWCLLLIAAVQGEVPDEFLVYQPKHAEHTIIDIVADVDIPRDGEIIIGWNFDKAIDYREVNKVRVAATGPPGLYSSTVTMILIDYDARTTIKREQRLEFEITARGPPYIPDPIPVDPDDPNPPRPVDLTGEIYSIVIRDATELTADQSEVLLSLRTYSDKTAGVQHLEFPPDAKNGDGSANAVVANYVSQMPRNATMPYGFITQARKDGGAHVHWQGEVHDTESVIAEIERVLK